jgi:hypothetical protein
MSAGVPYEIGNVYSGSVLDFDCRVIAVFHLVMAALSRDSTGALSSVRI